MTYKQYMSLIFVSVLSLVIRLIPRAPVRLAMMPAWLSPVAAVVPALVYVVGMWSLMKNRREDQGLEDMIILSLGKAGGKIILGLFGLWILWYTGFTLRTAATRLLTAVYEEGKLPFFLIVTFVASFIAAFSIKAVGRMAEVFSIIIVAALAIILFFALWDVKEENLLPVTYLDTGKILLGSLPCVNVFTVFGVLAFLAGNVEAIEEKSSLKASLFNSLLLLFIIFAISVVNIGMLSAWIVRSSLNTFFVMVRNVALFNVIERFEALVVAIWVIADFILIGALLAVCCRIFKKTTGIKSEKLAMGSVGLAVIVLSFFVSPDAFVLNWLSETVVPIVSSGFMLGLLPAILIVGRIRKKI